MTWKELLADVGMIILKLLITTIGILILYAVLCLLATAAWSVLFSISPPTSVESIEPPLSSEIPQ